MAKRDSIYGFANATKWIPPCINWYEWESDGRVHIFYIYGISVLSRDSICDALKLSCKIYLPIYILSLLFLINHISIYLSLYFFMIK